MDSTVIQEIANQLGMAVDQAGQFISEHLPEYAALKVAKMMFPIQFLVPVLIVLLVVGVVAAVVSRYGIDSDLAVIGLGGAIIAFVGLALYILMCGGDIIGWMNYPGAMLIDKALTKVGV